MRTYKTVKGTNKVLYIKGLKSNYFYIFCGVGFGGLIVCILIGLDGNFILWASLGFIYLIGMYALFFYLSLDKPFSKIKSKYDVIRNIDLIKIRKP